MSDNDELESMIASSETTRRRRRQEDDEEHSPHLKLPPFLVSKYCRLIICLAMGFAVLQTDLLSTTGEATVSEGCVTSKIQSRRTASPGVVILGMHRSGTSLLAGLLAELGYNEGKTFGGNRHNPKGFHELETMVRQNKVFIKHQSDHRDLLFQKCKHFNVQLAWEEHMHNITDFSYGRQVLDFFRNSKPWIVKDPRLCLTLPIWLKLLVEEQNPSAASAPPAALHVYRHPLEVARSLHVWHNMTLVEGLQAWITYNERILDFSSNLCRVTVSNPELVADPARHLERIQTALFSECGVLSLPSGGKAPNGTDFLDKSLKNHDIHETARDENWDIAENRRDCIIYDPNGAFAPHTPSDDERLVYFRAMSLFCQLEQKERVTENGATIIS